MKNFLEKINNSLLSPDERIAALKEFIEAGGLEKMQPFTGEINNHIHTIYSFSPYTPAMAALKAREAGLEVAGSVDHDSYSAADEMRRACNLLNIGCVTGFEVRVSFKQTKFADRKINNPDSKGIVYMTVQGVPENATKKVEEFLSPICIERGKRNRAQVDNLNALLEKASITPLSYDNDILPLSQANKKGSVTERHILYALAHRFVDIAGKGDGLIKLLTEKFDIKLSAKQMSLLSDTESPHYLYDLLGILKSGFLEKIFIQPSESECISVEKVTSFAQSIGAFPAYAYLGDVGESPTGDKKAEKFEDDFLDELIPSLKELGYLAITYMPPRNTREQLLRLQKLCSKYGFMEISGVDINSSRQKFDCPEIRLPEFRHLVDTTWALAAHEKMCNFNAKFSLFSESNPMANESLEKRITTYAEIGKKMITGLSCEEASAMIKP